MSSAKDLDFIVSGRGSSEDFFGFGSVLGFGLWVFLKQNNDTI